jgi:hypothetical protein
VIEGEASSLTVGSLPARRPTAARVLPRVEYSGVQASRREFLAEDETGDPSADHGDARYVTHG